MNRIIINNKTDLSDLQALRLVLDVVGSGRISNENNQYCYLSTWISPEDEQYQISTNLNKSSDSFTIIKIN